MPKKQEHESSHTTRQPRQRHHRRNGEEPDSYPEGIEADIELLAKSDGKELTFVLSDQGREFDPTAKEDSDMSVNPAERDLGGMGIFIVKNIMNKVTYQRLEGKNLLTMTKGIE